MRKNYRIYLDKIILGVGGRMIIEYLRRTERTL